MSEESFASCESGSARSSVSTPSDPTPSTMDSERKEPLLQSKARTVQSFSDDQSTNESTLHPASSRRGRSAPGRNDALWNRWHFSLSTWTSITDVRPQTLDTLPVLDGGRYQYESLSSAQLARMISLGDPWLVVVDVRDTDFFFGGHIPRCWHIPSESFAQRMAQLVYHCNKHWYRPVFCCFDGVRRSSACARRFQKALRACYRREECCSAFVLTGGMCDWARFCEAFGFEGGLERATVNDAIAFAQQQ